MSSLGKQDKDFKRLNKESLAHNATTAHEQYMYRQSSDCRITHPSLRKSFYASGGFTGFQHPTPLPAFLNAEHTYGLPLRPGTPIKAVVGNLYGEVAAYQKKKYHQSLNEQDKVLLNRLLNPPRNETRASKMASTFTNMNYKNAANSVEPKRQFKMRKFLSVNKKLDSINHGYQPPQRLQASKSQIRT